jgi:hypothetical protein
MAETFILHLTATEIEAEDSATRADQWLATAAEYVVSLEQGQFLNCYERAYVGFRDGWRILSSANLTSKSMDEYLREAKPQGALTQALPRAK